MSTYLQAPPSVEVSLPPRAASTTSKTRRPWLTVILAVALSGALGFALFQTTTLSGVNSDLAASQTTVGNLKDDVSGLQADLGNAQASVASLEGTVADQDVQLAACARANTLSVKADQAFHDAIGGMSGAIFGSGATFYSNLAKYRQYARQWAVAANQCEPGAGYSFG